MHQRNVLRRDLHLHGVRSVEGHQFHQRICLFHGLSQSRIEQPSNQSGRGRNDVPALNADPQTGKLALELLDFALGSRCICLSGSAVRQQLGLLFPVRRTFPLDVCLCPAHVIGRTDRLGFGLLKLVLALFPFVQTLHPNSGQRIGTSHLPFGQGQGDCLRCRLRRVAYCFERCSTHIKAPCPTERNPLFLQCIGLVGIGSIGLLLGLHLCLQTLKQLRIHVIFLYLREVHQGVPLHDRISFLYAPSRYAPRHHRRQQLGAAVWLTNHNDPVIGDVLGPRQKEGCHYKRRGKQNPALSGKQTSAGGSLFKCLVKTGIHVFNHPIIVQV